MSTPDGIKENNQNGENINESNSGNMKQISVNKIVSFCVKTTAENHENVIKTDSIIAAEENMQSITLKHTLTEEINNKCVNNACAINTEISNENNSKKKLEDDNPKKYISNFEITATTFNNVTEENSLLTSDSEVQANGAELNQTTNSNLNNEQENGILETVKDLSKFGLFIIYSADIVTDITVALQLLSIGNLKGYYILYFFYLSSFYCTNIERTINNRASFLLFTVIFILNISGVIAYIEVMLLLYRKLRKKTYDKDLLHFKQQVLERIISNEAFMEAYPQLMVQSLIISDLVEANENISCMKHTILLLQIT